MTKKAFISYSRTSEDHLSRVVRIAENLRVDHGIDVILDVWDCTEGDDLNYFMESMVNDETIDFVIILSDIQYCNRANDREGGVGKESTIISSQIYDKQRDSKFIPVFLDILSDGKPALPTFCNTRFAIDMTDIELDIEKTEEIARKIHNKPLFEKPKIGKVPDYNQNQNDLKKAIKKLNFSKSYNETRNFEEALDIIYKTLENIENSVEEYNRDDLMTLKEVFDTWKELITYALNNDNFYFRELIIEHYNRCLKLTEEEFKNPMTRIFNYFSFLILVSEALSSGANEFLKDLLNAKFHFSRRETNYYILSLYPQALSKKYSYYTNVKKMLAEIYFEGKDLKKVQDADVILYTESLMKKEIHNVYETWHGVLLDSKWIFLEQQTINILINKFRSKKYLKQFDFLFGSSQREVFENYEKIKSSQEIPTIFNFIDKEEIGSY
ncbi:TIR domain-containing protein [Staphylococcus pseudintermedius]|uniref:SEFIR domain-containing protein n=1 Tax=Staphylococcus pseudintermedius TaxID=283734 RepID=UPI001915DA28|nr:SEFIR domain-containing protein [Staphylococcus pseudintermedius]QQJ71396.1 TIR domain-containing protein [Staphylococcus pseudintermedius]HAR6224973.1 TIR domain-containing protein [Staphylococcus pseudintermedius]